LKDREDGKLVKAVRGAIVAEDNTGEAIFKATQTLLKSMLDKNGLSMDAVISVFFTATSDLNAGFPAHAAREMGWTRVPMLCAQEMKVPGSMPSVIRALMHVNTKERARALRHQYLGQARELRPDLLEDRVE
jgi:chorismate mutase